MTICTVNSSSQAVSYTCGMLLLLLLLLWLWLWLWGQSHAALAGFELFV